MEKKVAGISVEKFYEKAYSVSIVISYDRCPFDHDVFTGKNTAATTKKAASSYSKTSTSTAPQKTSCKHLGSQAATTASSKSDL